MERLQSLLEKAQSLPQGPGCYLMKDTQNRVIYVGKAKRLKSRVTSYFNSTPKSVKTQFLVSHVQDFEFILTTSEMESFVLENNLIKKHAPKYNIQLKDDKTYPWVVINHEESFPRLEYVRRPKKGKGRELFGPFPVGSNISMVMRVLTKSFMLRDCSLSEFKSRKTPCLLYQMRQCSAPCVGYIDQAAYEEELNLAKGFFAGEVRARKAIKVLNEKMQKLAESEEFEHAAIVRDQLSILEDFLTKSYQQHVESLKDEKDVDVWSCYLGEEEFDFGVYMVRGGMLIGQKSFHFPRTDLMEDIKEELKTWLLQYYADPNEVIPELVIVDEVEEDLTNFAEALRRILEQKRLQVMGDKKKYRPLLEMCRKWIAENQRVRVSQQESVFIGLKKLKELLELKDLPRRLECYDVAIWQGKSPTAAQVVSYDGKPDKAAYRHYGLTELAEGNNDFAMMKEVISRRIPHGNLPDVIVIDGGVAQVNTVVAVLKELGQEVPVIGIAKSRDLTGDFKSKSSVRSEERLIIPGRSNPYILTKNPALFRIIVSLRDEAHRFSRRLHHKREHKRVLSTWVDEVTGLQQKSKDKILQNLSLPKDRLKELSGEELVEMWGITLSQASLVLEYLLEENEDETN